MYVFVGVMCGLVLFVRMKLFSYNFMHSFFKSNFMYSLPNLMLGYGGSLTLLLSIQKEINFI
jgi:hypothetical protein